MYNNSSSNLIRSNPVSNTSRIAIIQLTLIMGVIVLIILIMRVIAIIIMNTITTSLTDDLLTIASTITSVLITIIGTKLSLIARKHY